MGTEPMPSEIVKSEAPRGERQNVKVQLGRGPIFDSMAEVWATAQAFAGAGMGPRLKSRNEPGSAAYIKESAASMAASIALGQALGVNPITAIGSITVVNGRTGIMGDLALSLVRRSGLLERPGFIRTEYIGVVGEKSYACRITSRRSDTGEEMTREFSVGDAQQARLWGKSGGQGVSPWEGFGKRMLYYRALGFLLRDLYGDVLSGCHLAEELEHNRDEDDDVPPPVRPEPAQQSEPDPLFELPATAESLEGSRAELITAPDPVLESAEVVTVAEAKPLEGSEPKTAKLW